MQPTIPVLVCAFSTLRGLERPSRRKLLGIACAMFGALYLTYVDSPSEQKSLAEAATTPLVQSANTTELGAAASSAFRKRG